MHVSMWPWYMREVFSGKSHTAKLSLDTEVFGQAVFKIPAGLSGDQEWQTGSPNMLFRSY